MTVENPPPFPVSWETMAGEDGMPDQEFSEYYEKAYKQRTAEEDALRWTRLGAVKARLGAQADKIDFLQAVGLLPDDLYVVSVETDVRRGVEKIVRIFEEFDVPEAARTAIADALAPAT